MPIFAVGELLHPRTEPALTVRQPVADGRWAGRTGFALGVLLSVGGTGVLIAVNWVSPIRFVRC